VIDIFNDRMSHSDMTLLILASAAMTIPFIYLAKDMANSLREIAKTKTGAAE
jgi:hypothetical protein